jgi:L,D-transpeptidase catalytic domain
MSDCDRPGMMALRAALVSSVALAFLVGLAQPADAATFRARAVAAVKKPNPEKDGFGEATKGVLQIVVSIGSQRVTLFSNGVRVAQGGVSTGTPGHPTPMGVFSIIQKDRYHHSNLYGNAPMYYMQRITWSGVAMHEGVLPGHAASHGCIRLSHGFAAALWPTTKLGVRVIVARHDLAPTDFEHPKLFAPRPKPADPLVAMSKPHPEGLVRVAASTAPSTDARGLEVNPSAPEAAKPAAIDVDPPKPVAPNRRFADPPLKRTGQVAVFVSRKEQKVFVRQGFVPLFDMPVVIEESDRPLGTHVFTAMGAGAEGTGMRWNLITIPTSDPERSGEKLRSRRSSKEPVKVAAVESKPSSSAAEALDRIRLPSEAVERISELLTPGSSLIVSDKGNSYETGRGTEFIVLAR